MPLRLKAFTLPELLVSMALTAILILMGQKVYITFGRFHARYEQLSCETYQSFGARLALKGDFEKATAFSRKGDHLTLFQANDSLCQYRLTDSLLIRQIGLQIDSFPFRGKWHSGEHKGYFCLQDESLNLTFSFRPVPYGGPD